MISDQVWILWQDFNSFWFTLWLCLINAENYEQEERQSIRSKLAGAYMYICHGQDQV